MPYQNINLGLLLKIPTNGTRNWAAQMLQNTWKKISSHDHTGGGAGAQIPAGGIANGSITTAKLADDAVTSAKIGPNIALTVGATLTPAGAVQTIDFDTGNIQTLDLSSSSGDVTVTLSNPQAGAVYWIWIIQGAVDRNVIWPASVKWPQTQSPLLSSGVGKIDLVTLYYTGSTYRGQWELDFS